MPEHTLGYCRNCEAEQPILLTVPWQDDQCRACGSTDIDLERPA